MFRKASDTAKHRATGMPYAFSKGVYIATIDEHPGLVKIGSSMYVDTRINALSSGYGLTFRLYSDYPEDVERKAHKVLSDRIHTGEISEKKKTGVEIFNCPAEEADRIIRGLIEDAKYNYKRVK